MAKHWFEKELSLADIERLIDERTASLNERITLLEQLMATNQTDFDAKLAQLGPAIAQVKTDFEAYKAAATAQGVDLTNEANSLQSSLDALTALHTEITAPAASSPANPNPSATTQAPASNG